MEKPRRGGGLALVQTRDPGECEGREKLHGLALGLLQWKSCLPEQAAGCPRSAAEREEKLKIEAVRLMAAVAGVDLDGAPTRMGHRPGWDTEGKR